MEPSLSRADLRFHLWGIPVRVHPLFWLTMAFLGWGIGDIVGIALWVGACFVSILVHEMGHTQCAQQFNHSPRIVLYGFGGLTIYHSRSSDPVWQAIAILFCGSGAGFLFAGVLFIFNSITGFLNTPYFEQLYSYFIWINVSWGLLNLLPIFPLDGGQITLHACQLVDKHRGNRIAIIISLIMASLMALLAYFLHQSYLAIIFIYFAIMNFQEWS